MGPALQLVLRQGGVSAPAHPALGAFYGPTRLCRFGRGAGVGHDPRPEARASAVAAGSSGDRPPHAGAVASVVAGPLRGKFVLASSPRPIHAAVVSQNDASVVVPQL